MLSKHIPQSTANRQTLFISDNHHTQLHPQLTVQNIMYMCDILLYRLCMQWTSTIHEMIVKRRFLRCLEQGFSKRSNKSDFSYLRQAATHITLKVGPKLVTTLSQFLFECWVALLRVYYSQQANIIYLRQPPHPSSSLVKSPKLYVMHKIHLKLRESTQNYSHCIYHDFYTRNCKEDTCRCQVGRFALTKDQGIRNSLNLCFEALKWQIQRLYVLLSSSSDHSKVTIYVLY